MMKYCFDTSALIGLGERHYPERVEVFKPIWEHIYAEIDRGNIISSDYVKYELEKKAADWRKTFIKNAEKMFKIDQSIEKEYANVIMEIEGKKELNINNHRKRFMSGADPWVIAVARSVGKCTVISAETKSLADYGLEAICHLLGVKHMNLVEFIEENKIA